MAEKIKNYTFSLPVDMVDKVREFTESKYIPSINTGIKEAIVDYINKIEKDILKKEVEEASEDPLFLKDIKKCVVDFENSDAEMANIKNTSYDVLALIRLINISRPAFVDSISWSLYNKEWLKPSKNKEQ